MNNIITVLVVLLGSQFLICGASHARSTGPGKGSGIPEGGGSEPISLGDASKNPDTIRGHCSLVENAETSLVVPCGDLLVTLLDADGIELARTRTSAKGGFKFAADKGKNYRLGTAATIYEVLSPTANITGGATVELKIQRPSESLKRGE